VAANPTITPMTMRAVAVRDITTNECPWISRDILIGELLSATTDLYGVVSDNGIAVEFDGQSGYVEVPADAVVGIRD
jgi:hypothetical protein